MLEKYYLTKKKKKRDHMYFFYHDVKALNRNLFFEFVKQGFKYALPVFNFILFYFIFWSLHYLII